MKKLTEATTPVFSSEYRIALWGGKNENVEFTLPHPPTKEMLEALTIEQGFKYAKVTTIQYHAQSYMVLDIPEPKQN